MVGGEGLADRRFRRPVGHGQRGLQHVPDLPRVHLPERMPALGSALGARLPAVIEQLVHPRGHPAVPDHPVGVVVHHGDQRVRLFPRVAEHADDLVLVAQEVGVDVALGGGHRAQVLGPAGAGHAALDQVQGRALGLGRLPGRAEAGDPGQQGQGRWAALPGRVVDQPLADQLLHRGRAARTAPAGRTRGALKLTPARPVLAPPGAEQLADHEFGVQRAAHGQQLAGGTQHLGEQGVRGRDVRATHAAAWPA